MNKPYLILFLLLSSFGYCQTYIDVTEQYIQNPSFEDYTACPQSNSAYPNDMWIDSVVGWYAPTAGTSDYFNACNTTSNGIPYNNGAYHQFPYDGVAYCGFLAYAPDYTQNDIMWCEYIQTKLLKPLRAAKYYRFTMRINRANDYNLAVQNIGANFSKNANTDFSGTKPYNLIPTILNNTGFLTDTLDWVLVQGEFLATGVEEYLTIGWFGDTISSDYAFYILPEIDSVTGDSIYLTETYYLVDSLKLFEMGYEIKDFKINIITPNGDHHNDVIDFSNYRFNELKFEVFSRWGNIVWETSDPNAKWEGTTTSGKAVSDGTYYYSLEGTDAEGNSINKSGFIQVIR